MPSHHGGEQLGAAGFSLLAQQSEQEYIAECD